jgi:hypothetical protein
MGHDAALEAHEHTEHAEHAAHEHDPFISRVAITVAALAVLAAAAGSLETMEGEGSLGATSEAVLMQDRATDTWNEFQADSIKKHIYTVASRSTTTATDIAYYKKQAKEYGETQNKLHKDADDREAERDNLLKESAHHEERHKWLTGSATLFEIGIAMSTVAIITKRNYLWFGALTFGAVGLGLLAYTYLGV